MRGRVSADCRSVTYNDVSHQGFLGLSAVMHSLQTASGSFHSTRESTRNMAHNCTTTCRRLACKPPHRKHRMHTITFMTGSDLTDRSGDSPPAAVACPRTGPDRVRFTSDGPMVAEPMPLPIFIVMTCHSKRLLIIKFLYRNSI